MRVQDGYREGGLFTLDAIFLLNVGSAVDGLLIAVVPDSDVGTGLGEALCDRKTNTRSGTRNDGGSTFEGK